METSISSSKKLQTDDSAETHSDPGQGKHWFDYAYKTARWCLDEERRWLPKSLRRLAGRASITAYAYAEKYHINAGDWPDKWSRTLVAPDDVHVSTPAIWVIELFPPSKAAQLDKALADRWWSNDSYRLSFGETPSETAHSARASNGMRWWRLGNLTSREITYWVPNSVKADLPQPFVAVEASVVQIGSSLTAVCAFFRMGDKWAVAADEEWHRDHPAAIYKPDNRMLPRQLSDKMREHLLAVHESLFQPQRDARLWMKEHFPGVFAKLKADQPVLELALFKNSSTSDLLGDDSNLILDCFGMHAIDELYAKGRPSLAVRNCQSHFRDSPLRPYYGLLGEIGSVEQDLQEQLAMYPGQETDNAIAFAINDTARRILLELSLVEYSERLIRTYGSNRDLSEKWYESYSPTHVDALRSFILDNSIDLAEATRDIGAYFRESKAQAVPLLRRYTRSVDAARQQDPSDATDEFARKAKRNLEQLVEMDAVYRDVLSTVVSLGTDKRSLEIAWIALVVSIVSLLLAILTMSTAGDTVFGLLFNLFTQPNLTQ